MIFLKLFRIKHHFLNNNENLLNLSFNLIYVYVKFLIPNHLKKSVRGEVTRQMSLFAIKSIKGQGSNVRGRHRSSVKY